MAKASSRSSEKSSHHPMLRYISLGLIVLGLFFGILFYTYDSSVNGAAGAFHESYLYTYILILTALGIAAVILLVYRHANRLTKMLENGVVITLAVIAGLAINELNSGITANFGANTAPEATLNVYACLLVGFVGSGALMAVLHNLYNKKSISFTL
tara:strand:+ start:932 stop:1399 length:468 start_codon:yes stop_codon:yes gene_type:complete